MRRLPVYFLVDVSESMVGTPILQVQDGMRSIIQDLRVDPYALETAFVSIIAFAGKAKMLMPLTELYKFYPPVFPIGGGTSLAAGLTMLMDDMDASLQKTTLEVKGDWKPIIFLFTDGNPTDDCQAAFARWNAKYRRACSLVAISLGDNVNVDILGQLTDDVLLLKNTDAESFKKFFKWITASIKTSSVAVNEQNKEGVQLPPTSGINLEKVDTKQRHGAVDENFVVLHGRCQTTKRDYLIKYAKRSQEMPGMEMFRPTDFKLVGAYPIDNESYAALSTGSAAKINSMELVGVPSCPCCGNQHAGVVCECGGIFCVSGEQEQIQCPWCGAVGYLGGSGEGGVNVSRGLG